MIGEPVSEWLLVCTVLLALVLGLGKRRHELTLLADEAAGHRRILDEYSPYLLDQMIGVVTASTLMAYIIYVASPDTVERFGTHLLVLTVPFPIYGILRYLYLVHRKGRRREPVGDVDRGPTAAHLRGTLGARDRNGHLPALRTVNADS